MQPKRGAEIESLRALWTRQCNGALSRRHHQSRIDHRSYEREEEQKIIQKQRVDAKKRNRRLLNTDLIDQENQVFESK
ncbi:MobA/MobL family protein [Acetobacter thailandicus]|uniref:MobA/MobL family protein n=1 Tax=Acetobacter thailandicus TaxID=1502842 RepID=A0ABT3QEE8_9PROT|nr:MobA/MobL family protein [Acetobacter thailandicus]